MSRSASDSNRLQHLLRLFQHDNSSLLAGLGNTRCFDANHRIRKGIFLSKRHTIISGLMALFILFPVMAIIFYDIELNAPHILIATIILVVAGLAAGALLPGTVTTWIIILLTVVGAAILLFGTVPISIFQKLILLVAFPASAGIMSIVRYALIRFGWVTFSRRAVERYTQHYNRTTKLQTGYNAAKMYRKIVHFVQDDYDPTLWYTVTAVHWAHGSQYRQFHAANYDATLSEIAGVLKEDRLPSESLYYLGHGTFLIISHQLPDETYEKRNEFTKSHLDQLRSTGTTVQFKWGSLKIDRSNVTDYLTLKDAVRRLQRDMETDLVVEYLKGDVA